LGDIQSLLEAGEHAVFGPVLIESVVLRVEDRLIVAGRQQEHEDSGPAYELRKAVRKENEFLKHYNHGQDFKNY
jgi:hypothetical protein